MERYLGRYSDFCYAAVRLVAGFLFACQKAHAPRSFWPILNFGELAAFFSFFFLYVASKGSGKYSIDGWIARMRGARSRA
jgi:putative oxidoreductase